MVNYMMDDFAVRVMKQTKLTGGGSFVGLYIDDERDLPEDKTKAGWTLARSFHEAILKLEIMDFAEISVDHDLASFYGPYKEMTGYDILIWLVQRKENGLHVPPIVKVHSANPCGHERMQGVIDRYLS